MYEVEIHVTEEHKGMRLDMFIAAETELTRSFVQYLVDKELVSQLGSDRKVKRSKRVKPGSTYIIKIPPPKNLNIVPEPVDFDVLYEDSHIIVIDKPANLVVHPAPGNWEKTLVHGLLYRYPDIGSINNVIRPGIVHRLDSTTSGLMVIARNEDALSDLQSQFKSREVIKVYLALAEGVPPFEKGRLDLPVGRNSSDRYKMAVTGDGKPSLTEYRVIWTKGTYSLIACRLHSGRTHQIRVHMKYIGCPLVGDKLYGHKNRNRTMDNFNRVFLHSWKLGFLHPSGGKEMHFTSPLPQDLVAYLQNILSRDQEW